MKSCDDEIIKRRVLINGPNGDDDRLNLLIKLITKWSRSDSNAELDKLYHDKILCLLSAAEAEVKKSYLQEQRMAKDLISYKCIHEQLTVEIGNIDRIISRCKQTISSFKERLQLFTSTIKPLLESIKSYPSLNESLRKMHIHQEHIVNLHDANEALKKKSVLASLNMQKVGLARTRLKDLIEDLGEL